MPVCACTCPALILKEVGVGSQVTHSGTQHTAIWTVRDRHRHPRPGDRTDRWAVGKDIMLGFTVSTAAMKLAAPGLRVHPLLLSSSAVT